MRSLQRTCENSIWKCKEDFIAFLLIGAACLPLLIAMWQPIPYVIERFTPDDAYYYLNTALNIAKGHGSTFDRINQTNGYHPLWMLILVPIYKAFGGVELPLRISLSIEVLFAFLSMWLAFKLAREFMPLAIAALSPALLFAFVWLAGFYALESHLLVLMSLIAAAFASFRPNIFDPTSATADDILWGFILGAVALSRLDASFVFVSYLCILTAAGIRRGKISSAKLIRSISPFAFMLATYLLWNKCNFGHWMPISGALKTSFPKLVLLPRHLLIKPVIVRMAIPLVSSIAYFLVTILGEPSNRLRQMHTPLIMFNLYVIFHSCYSAFLQDWGVFPWYFALSLSIASLTLPALTSLLLCRQNVLSVSMAAACILLVAFAGAGKFLLPSRHYGLRRLYEQAIWLKVNTEPDAICIAEDAGIIGYYSQRRVINLDGLINSYEYQEYLKHGRFSDYLHKKGVQYFIATRGNPEPGKLFRYEAYSHLYNVRGGSVELQPHMRVSGAPMPTWRLRR